MALTINKVATDNIVNFDELQSGVTFSGTFASATSFRYSLVDGDPNIVIATGFSSVSFGGFSLYLDASNFYGTGTQGDGAYTLTVTGYTGSGSSRVQNGEAGQFSITVDTSADRDTPATLTFAKTVINANDSRAVSFTVAGLDADAHANVVLDNPSGGAPTSTSVAANGTFTVTPFIADGNVTTHLEITDAAGNKKSVAGPSFVLDTTSDAGALISITLDDGVGTHGDIINGQHNSAVKYHLANIDSDVVDVTIVVFGNDAVSGDRTNTSFEVGSFDASTGVGSGTLDLSGFKDGQLTFQVQATDTHGNSGGPTSTFTLDTSADADATPLSATVYDNADATAHDGYVNAGDAQSTFHITGLDSDAHVASVVLHGAGHADVTLTSVTVTNNTIDISNAVSQFSDGLLTVTANVQDNAGNTTSAFATTTIDRTAPTVALSLASDTGYDHTDELTNDGRVILSASDAASLSTVQYQIDSGSIQTSTNGATITLTEGSHTILEKATDAAGNVASTTLTVTVDTVSPDAPTLSLLNDTSHGSSRTSDAGLTIAGVEAHATVEYQVGTGAWSTAQPVATVDGDYTVRVRQTDAAGNVGATSTLTFTLDTSADTGTAASATHAGGYVNASEASASTFAIAGLDADATAVLTVGDGSGHSQTATITGNGNATLDLHNLSDGALTVHLDITDTAKNTKSVTSAASLTLDTSADNDATPLSLSADAGGLVDGYVNAAHVASVAYSATGLDSDISSESVSFTGLAKTGGTLTTHGSVATGAGGTATGSADLSAFADGDVTATITVTDAAGNQASTSTTLHLDTTADVGGDLHVVINDGTDHASSDGYLNAAERTAFGTAVPISITGLDADASITAVQISGKVNHVDTTINATNGVNGWTADLSSFDDGTVTINATATDTHSNTAQALAATTTIDRVAPESLNFHYYGKAWQAHTDANYVQVVVDQPNEAHLLIQTLNNGQWLTLFDRDGTVHDVNYPTLVQGENVMSVRAVDLAGNIGPETTLNINYDTVKPVAPGVSLEFDSGVAGDLRTSSKVIQVDQLESSAHIQVILDDTIVTNYDPAYQTPTLLYPYSNLADGEHTITVRQADLAGNHSDPTSLTFTIDTSADTGAKATVTQSNSLVNKLQSAHVSFTIAGLDSDASATIDVYDKTSHVTKTVASNGSFDVDISTLSDGDLNYQINIADTTGNTATAVGGKFTLDTQVATPTVTLHNDTTAAGYAGGSDKITSVSTLDVGNIESGATVEFSADGKTWSTTQPTLSDGPTSVWVRQTDPAGNVSASQKFSFTRDTHADTAENGVLTPVAYAELNGFVNQNAVSNVKGEATGVDNDVVSTQIVFTQGSTHTTTGNDLSSFADGSVTETVTVIDKAGNTASATHTFTIDTTADAGHDLTVSLNAGATYVNNAGKNAVATTFTGIDSDVTSVTVDYAGKDSNGADKIFTVKATHGNGGWTIAGADLSSFQDGTVTATVHVTDAAGNTASATTTTQLDTSADKDPAATVVQSDSLVSKSESTHVSFTVAGLDSDATGTITVSDGQSHTTTMVVSANGPVDLDLSGLTDGRLDYTMGITDAAYNTATVTGGSFTLDTQVATPTVTLHNDTTAKIYEGASDKITSDSTLDVTDAGETVTVSFSTNGTLWSTSQPTFTTDGDKTVYVRQTDLAGNVSEVTTFSFTRDTTADADDNLGVSITTNNSAYVNSSEISSVDVKQSGVDSDVVWTGVVFSQNGTTLPQIGRTDLSAFADGSVTETITVIDKAGNTASATHTFTIDTTADAGHDLAVSLNAGAPYVNNAGKSAVATTFTGIDSDVTSVTVDYAGKDSNGADKTVTLTATHDNGGWTIANADLSSFQDGTVTATVHVTDAAGNTASATTTTQLDTSADLTPTLSIDLHGAADDGVISRAEAGALHYTINGVDGDARNVRVSVTDGTHTVALYDADNTFRPGSTIPLSDGNITVTAEVVDAAGNHATVTQTLTLDTVAKISINDFSLTPSNTAHDYTFIGTAETIGKDVTVHVGGHDYTATVGASHTWSVTVGRDVMESLTADSVISASTTDVYGNTGSAFKPIGLDSAGNDTIVVTKLEQYDSAHQPGHAGYVADTYNGGGGVNTLDYSARNVQTTVDLPAGTVNIHGNVDHISNFTNFIFGNVDVTFTADGKGDSITTDANDPDNYGYGNHVITGGAGADTVSLGGGDNVVTGGGGDDQITAGDGANSITGDDGADTITAGHGDNWIDGGTGDDVITVGDGWNTIWGGGGADTITAGHGSNTIYGYGEDGDSTATDAETITVQGYYEATIIDAGSPSQTLYVEESTNSIFTGAGADHITIGDGAYVVDAGDGDNVVSALAGASVGGEYLITTGSGADSVSVSNGSSSLISATISTGAGNDSISVGWADNASINAGDGDNTVYATGDRMVITTNSVENSSDTIITHVSSGANTIDVVGEFDHITTGSGDDSITVSGNGVTIDAGDGNNTVDFGAWSFDKASIRTGSGADSVTVNGATSIDTVSGTTFTTSVIVSTGAGDDTVALDQVAWSTIDAGDGDNTITVTSGSQVTVSAGSGNNALDLQGSAFDVTLGDGDNHIAANGDFMWVLAGDGNNTITTYGRNAQFTSGAGDDSVSIFGNSAWVRAGDGANHISVEGNDASVGGGADADSITVSGDHAQIYTYEFGVPSDGNDTVSVTGDISFVHSSDGADSISVTGDGAVVDAGDGANTITVTAQGAQLVQIQTGSGDDSVTVYGTAIMDSGTSVSTWAIISTGAGDDTILATHVDHSTINAGAGANSITGSGDHDAITAGNGADKVTWVGSHNTIDLGDGDNILTGSGSVSSNSNSITSGSGADHIDINGDANKLTDGGGANVVKVHGSGNILSLGDGDDVVTLTSTGGVANTVFGGGGTNSFDVKAGGDNEVNGGGGTDFLTVHHSWASMDVSEFSGTVTLTVSGETTDASDIENFTFYDGTTKLTGTLQNILEAAPTALTFEGAASEPAHERTVDENTTGSLVATLHADDINAVVGDTSTFTFAKNAQGHDLNDGGNFLIVGNELRIANNAVLDYEAGVDRTVTIVATDAKGETFTQDFTIHLNDLNDVAPHFTSADTFDVNENGTAAFTAETTDGDGTLANQKVTYALTGGADKDLFNIDSTTGVVTFKSAPDYEHPAHDTGNLVADNDYHVTVTATNVGVGGTTLTTDQDVTIHVKDVNDNPTVFASDTASASVDENSTAVFYTAQATDADGTAANNTVTYSLATGGDSSLFTIDSATGKVHFAAGANYEDTGHSPTYTFTVVADDSFAGGSHQSTQAVTLAVNDLNDNAPVFTPASIAAATANVDENSTAVFYQAVTTDADGTAANTGVTYSLTGTDAALFTIDSSSGKVSFVAGADYEYYTFNVLATNVGVDVTQSTAQAVTVHVNDLNDNLPTITSAATMSIAENSTSVGSILVADADSPSHFAIKYDLGSGGDSNLFTIDGSTGALSFKAAPDYEIPSHASGGNAYTVDIIAYDNAADLAHSHTVTQTLTVNVTNVVGGTITGDLADPNTIDVSAATSSPGNEEWTLTGGDSADTIAGNSGFDVIDGGLGNDTIHGMGGNETITGGGGNDVLYGDAGADTIFGGLGSDTIYGGLGSDTLTGGVTAGGSSEGNDKFMMSTWQDYKDGNYDTITDFRIHSASASTRDVLGFSVSDFTGHGLTTTTANNIQTMTDMTVIISGDQRATTTARFVFDKVTSDLWFDGTQANDLVKIAHLTGVTSPLIGTDFSIS